MELAKLIAAFSIALFASFFVVEILSLAYKSPDITYNSCSGSSLCSQFIEKQLEKQCGKASATTPGIESGISYYYDCQSKVYSSDEYQKCAKDAQGTQETCQKNLAWQLQNYHVVSFILYGLAGVLFIIVGFLMLGYRSIGSGLILGGVFIILFSGYISLFSTLTSYGSLFSSFRGGTSGLSPEMFKLMRAILYFVVTALLIVMTYLRLDKPGLKSEED